MIRTMFLYRVYLRNSSGSVLESQSLYQSEQEAVNVMWLWVHAAEEGDVIDGMLYDHAPMTEVKE